MAKTNGNGHGRPSGGVDLLLRAVDEIAELQAQFGRMSGQMERSQKLLGRVAKTLGQVAVEMRRRFESHESRISALERGR